MRRIDYVLNIGNEVKLQLPKHMTTKEWRKLNRSIRLAWEKQKEEDNATEND